MSSSSSSSMSTAAYSTKSCFEQAISDVYYTTHSGVFNPNFNELLEDLKRLTKKNSVLPRSYRLGVLHPLITYLQNLREAKFEELYLENRESWELDDKKLKKAFEEVAEALLQWNYEFSYYKASFEDLKAFQAVISTIFLDVQKNISVISKVAGSILPPLAKCGVRDIRGLMLVLSKLILPI